MPKPGAGTAQANAHRKQAALSLAGFASAKSSTYDKKAVQKKKQALNSKIVNKYRKLKSRLQPQAGLQPASTDKADGATERDSQQWQSQPSFSPKIEQRQREPDAAVPEEQQGKQLGKKRKRPTELQKIAAAKESDREDAQKRKQEMLETAQRKREEQERLQQERRKQKAQFRKKTRTGQPVMKFRIEKMLSQLQAETGAA